MVEWKIVRDEKQDLHPDQEHLALIRQAVQEGNISKWNEWRKQHPSVQPALAGSAEIAPIRFSMGRPRGADLRGADLREADLRQANLHSAVLSGAQLLRANLRGAVLIQASGIHVDFRLADFTGALLDGAEFIQCEFSAANLTAAQLGGATLMGSWFKEANLDGADLTACKLLGVDFTGAYLYNAALGNADLTGATLESTDLSGARLIDTNLTDANLTNSRVYGISTWDVRLDRARQNNLIVTPPDMPSVSVDDLEIAQFIYLLIKYEKLGKVINSIAQKGVLILGRFGGGGLDTLRAVADKLRELKYLPIIFEFDRPGDRNYTETVKTLVGLSRFVIVDLSGPSVPQELYATVPHFKIPFVPILERGARPYSMFKDMLEYDWIIKPIVEFETTEALLNMIPSSVVAPAEQRHEARRKLLDQLFGVQN